MKKILALILFWSVCAFGAEQITMFVTVTNPAVTGNEITVNGTTRIFTNSYSAATIQTNSLAGPAATATNLAFSLSAYILSDNPWVYQTSTNIVRLVFPLGVVASGSQVGNWCAFTYSTQIVTRAWPVRVPMSIESATNQTNFASMIVTGLGKATNRFEAGWEVMTNFAAIARANDFTGTNRFRNGWWTNATLINLATAGGTLGNMTNGVLTNTILVWPVMTNASSYGGFRSPGTGSLSEQYGSGASATNDGALALGQNAKAGGLYAISIGQGSTAYGNFDVSIGSGAEGGYGSGVAIGTGAGLNASNAIAIGNSAIANYENSIAIGKSVATTETNQMMLGAATHKVRIPGRIEPTGTITNAVFTGTNSFGVSGGPYGALLFRRFNITTLADGTNAAVSPGDSSYIKITTGPTATFGIAGITNWSDGRFLIIQNSTGVGLNVLNDSGVDPSPANRIYTGTGATLVLTNSHSSVQLIYDSVLSRWVVLSHSD